VILVIDDDPVMRELLRLHLANAGYDVELAEDAIIGGRSALDNKPDIAIVDVDMPYMDGYELVYAMKADPATADIPVIFLSSREDVDERAAALRAEAHLRKPVNADRLLELVALFCPPNAQAHSTRMLDR
jgi:DNA-binding response OmpR family regulator